MKFNTSPRYNNFISTFCVTVFFVKYGGPGNGFFCHWLRNEGLFVTGKISKFCEPLFNDQPC